MNQVIISDLNRTPIVQILTWFTLVTSLLAFFTHAGIKFYVFRSLTIESWLVLAALVFCVAQSIAVSLQAHYGFGTPIATLDGYQIESNLKCEYAAMILFIVSLGFSKLAVVAFVHQLTPSEFHRRINFGLTWWNIVSCFNIITEIAIVALELGITARLQIRRQRKAAVMTLFSCRLLVLVAAAIQLGFFNRESTDAALKDDLTLGY
ncbi:unnamed protein product [Alternaria alternata]